MNPGETQMFFRNYPETGKFPASFEHQLPSGIITNALWTPDPCKNPVQSVRVGVNLLRISRQNRVADSQVPLQEIAV